MGVVRPDGTPWSRGTVGNDLLAIKEEWKKRASESFDAHVAEMMASLDEIEAAAWASQNLDALLRSHDRRAKLLGLDRPQRKELSGPNGGPLPLLNLAPEKASEVLARLGYLDPEDGDGEDTETES